MPWAGNRPSSAASESQFGILKNNVLSTCDSPMRMDDFLKKHLNFIDGISKLLYSKMMSTSTENTLVSDEGSSIEQVEREINNSGDHALVLNPDEIQSDGNVTPVITSEIEGVSQLQSDENVTPVITSEIEGVSQLHSKDKAEESWCKKGDRKRKTVSSYLTPDMEILRRENWSWTKTTYLGILKNATSQNLRSIKLETGSYLSLIHISEPTRPY